MTTENEDNKGFDAGVEAAKAFLETSDMPLPMMDEYCVNPFDAEHAKGWNSVWADKAIKDRRKAPGVGIQTAVPFEKSYVFDHQAIGAFLDAVRDPASHFKGSVQEAGSSQFAQVVAHLMNNPGLVKPSAINPSAEPVITLSQEDKIAIYRIKDSWHIELTNSGRFYIASIHQDAVGPAVSDDQP